MTQPVWSPYNPTLRCWVILPACIYSLPPIKIGVFFCCSFTLATLPPALSPCWFGLFSLSTSLYCFLPAMVLSLRMQQLNDICDCFTMTPFFLGGSPFSVLVSSSTNFRTVLYSCLPFFYRLRPCYSVCVTTWRCDGNKTICGSYKVHAQLGRKWSNGFQYYFTMNACCRVIRMGLRNKNIFELLPNGVLRIYFFFTCCSCLHTCQSLRTNRSLLTIVIVEAQFDLTTGRRWKKVSMFEIICKVSPRHGLQIKKAFGVSM